MVILKLKDIASREIKGRVCTDDLEILYLQRAFEYNIMALDKMNKLFRAVALGNIHCMRSGLLYLSKLFVTRKALRSSNNAL